MKTGSVVGVILTLLFAIVAAAQSAGMTSTSDIKFPLDLSASECGATNQFFDDCTAECVLFDGDIQVQMTTFSDADGDHLRIALPLVKVDGIGMTSQADYHLISQTRSIQITHDNDPAFETSQIFRFKLIGAGPVRNEQMYLTAHITLDANGRPTAFVEKPGPTNPSFKCPGN